MLRAISLATLPLLLALSSAPSRADATSDLAKSRAAWRAAGIADYEYGYNKYCACHPDNPPETIVTVRDGRVVRVRHRPVGYDREVEAPRGLEYYWTVDGLFDLVSAALQKHAEVRATYDPALGYPTEIHVDYDRDLIGDEVDLRITRLDRLSGQ
ncbi:MAG TPA: DUF6174 domain-containing protein [Gammaproteobacteria bacterium]|nr:DUF6174 domain-containing protein [Gammaproteobacteria bacterium]